jgi:hypothetical protein
MHPETGDQTLRTSESTQWMLRLAMLVMWTST